MTDKHIQAIDKITAPKNVKALQRVLGMLNYWKKHVPHYSKNTYNMRQLLRKDVPFEWTAQCDAELAYLKKCLVSDPILKPIDPNRDLILSTDASCTGLGFCVMQADDRGDLYAVRYGSYATTKHQSNYSADDLEATALMYALKSVEWLAQCRKITVITDNAHVLHLKDWTPTNRRQKRMLAYLQQFHLSVLFIKGSKNLLPDALSRLYQDASVQERKEHEAKFVYEIDDFILPVTTRSANRAPVKTVPNARNVVINNGEDSASDDAATDSSALSPYAAPYFPQRLMNQYTDGGEMLDDSEQYNLPMGTFEQQNAWVDARVPQYNAMDLDPCDQRYAGQHSHRDVTYTDVNGQTGMLEPAEPQTDRNNLEPYTLEPSNHSPYTQRAGIAVENQPHVTRNQQPDVERGNYIASGDERDARSPAGLPADTHRHLPPPTP